MVRDIQFNVVDKLLQQIHDAIFVSIDVLETSFIDTSTVYRWALDALHTTVLNDSRPNFLMTLSN